jgi:hypothetical protein
MEMTKISHCRSSLSRQRGREYRIPGVLRQKSGHFSPNNPQFCKN